jgi:hypothetical protein
MTQSINLFTLISYLWIGLGDSSEANWLVPGTNSIRLSSPMLRLLAKRICC